MVLVGVDEAGAGPAFGSLWAAAVHLPTPIDGLRDSKRLSERKREGLRKTILCDAWYGLGEVTHTEIDVWGLGEARRVVFERALDDLLQRDYPMSPSHVIVDGTLFRPWRDVSYECVPKADDIHPCVSAASILAKTQRDRQVLEWCDDCPDLHTHYGIRSNKGYLSSVHMAGLVKHGWSPYHRRSYRIKGFSDGTTTTPP